MRGILTLLPFSTLSCHCTWCLSCNIIVCVFCLLLFAHFVWFKSILHPLFFARLFVSLNYLSRHFCLCTVRCCRFFGDDISPFCTVLASFRLIILRLMVANAPPAPIRTHPRLPEPLLIPLWPHIHMCLFGKFPIIYGRESHPAKTFLSFLCCLLVS